MQRSLELLLEKEHFPHRKIAFVVGPRQVGKTTLARSLLTQRRSTDLYRNWDDLAWRREFVREPYGFIDAFRPKAADKRPLAVLDEIHKYPRWKNFIKGLWETRAERIDLMVTGSGRLDVYQRGGDSLLGRYHQYRLHPFSLKEIFAPGDSAVEESPQRTMDNILRITGTAPVTIRKKLRDLLRWGGFPEPFLDQNERRHRLWVRERRNLIIKEDLRDLARIRMLSQVEELVELLVLRAGGVLSYNALREDLQVAVESVRQWTDQLQRLYFIYLIRPFAGKLPRALRKEPKIYLWDWSEIVEEGPRFENLLASHLLKWVHFTQDWGLPSLELHYLRDREKREVDFLLTLDRKPWVLLEAKLSSEKPSPALTYFAERLRAPYKIQVVLNLDRPGQAGDVHVIDAANFLRALPV
ncbi:MAG: ATP-binding protein [Deltaproteobacteria bacterium]|nr:ATP-binding protein [Deltaproteobacteria bacterium]